MGKTWGGTCFRLLGAPVHDADLCVHRLLGPGGAAVQLVGAAFPGVLDKTGGVDRRKLAQRVLGDDHALNTLEAMLHPMVRLDQRRFLEIHQRQGVRLVVLDIPLLYETDAHERVDAVVVMSASKLLQHQRVMRRVGMSEKKFQAILKRQIPDKIKRRRADYVVTTGSTRGQSLRQIANIVKICRTFRGQVWGPHWGR